jgi:hypothetical protein
VKTDSNSSSSSSSRSTATLTDAYLQMGHASGQQNCRGKLDYRKQKKIIRISVIDTNNIVTD